MDKKSTKVQHGCQGKNCWFSYNSERILCVKYTLLIIVRASLKNICIAMTKLHQRYIRALICSQDATDHYDAIYRDLEWMQ